MSPLFEELSRLARRYDDLCHSPFSCPRDREILRTRLVEYQAEAKRLRVRAIASDISDADCERLAAAFHETVQKKPASIQDLEELTMYVRFLSEVFKHLQARKEQAS